MVIYLIFVRMATELSAVRSVAHSYDAYLDVRGNNPSKSTQESVPPGAHLVDYSDIQQLEEWSRANAPPKDTDGNPTGSVLVFCVSGTRATFSANILRGRNEWKTIHYLIPSNPREMPGWKIVREFLRDK